MRVAVGSDHAGYEGDSPYKPAIMAHIEGLGHTVVDCGTNGPASVDYPDFAQCVCDTVLGGQAETGVLVCGTGIGMSIAANRRKGIRAALCYDIRTVINSREHNNANVLSLGGPLHDAGQLCDMAKTWLETRFGGGRHLARVNKIMAIERGGFSN